VLVNLVLVDDAALGPVVSALGGLGAHIVSLQKSEPSLEDVFVELVGRGFEEEGRGGSAAGGGPGSGSKAGGSVVPGRGSGDGLPIGEQLEPDEPYEPSQPVGSAR
jgi:hypothetical protein